MLQKLLNIITIAILVLAIIRVIFIVGYTTHYANQKDTYAECIKAVHNQTPMTKCKNDQQKTNTEFICSDVQTNYCWLEVK